MSAAKLIPSDFHFSNSCCAGKEQEPVPNARDLPGAPCHPQLGFLTLAHPPDHIFTGTPTVGAGTSGCPTPRQEDSVLGGGQGSPGVGEGLLETTLIKHIFTGTLYQRQGQAPAHSAGEGIRNPNTAEDPAGPRSEQVYVTALALGLSSVVQAQRPYHQLLPLGMGTSPGARGQGGQSFPPLLKDGDATPQRTQPPRPWGNHWTSEKHIPSTPETHGGRLQKCRSPFFSLPFHPHCKTGDRSCLAHSLQVGRGPKGAAGASFNGRALPPPPGMPGVNGKA